MDWCAALAGQYPDFRYALATAEAPDDAPTYAELSIDQRVLKIGSVCLIGE